MNIFTLLIVSFLFVRVCFFLRQTFVSFFDQLNNKEDDDDDDEDDRA
jgi:hypothetical protein